jgi:sugar O-acyltransferase (sialic acid O-acetyltransferase NeuD family)
MSNYCIYGASGHSKVIIEIIEKAGNVVLALYDDDKQKNLLLDYKVSSEKSVFQLSDVQWIIGIGDNRIREKIAQKHSFNYGQAIDKSCLISKRTKIGKGTVIMPGATINSSTIIGNHAIINTNSSIDHDCNVADFVHVSPKATLCGGISVGEGTHIGAGSILIPGIKIGKWVTIGAGSVIIKDVPDFVTIVGNPGKIIKFKDFGEA